MEGDAKKSCARLLRNTKKYAEECIKKEYNIFVQVKLVQLGVSSSDIGTVLMLSEAGATD